MRVLTTVVGNGAPAKLEEATVAATAAVDVDSLV